MLNTTNKKSYNCILAFANSQNKLDYQLLAYSYAQLLKQLGASNIAAVNKVDYTLTYPIQKKTDINFIEFSFLIAPKAIKAFQQRLSIDESILRSFITSVN